MQMYKVFINSLPVYFVKKGTEIQNNFVENTLFVDVEYVNFKDVLAKYSAIKTDTPDELVFLCANVQEVWEKFLIDYQFRVAAGGLVYNEKNELLLIFRNGVWDLPKGHVELNETIEAGAVREVEEECGILNPIITQKVLVTYHTYLYKDQQVLKENHWFNMRYTGDELLVPQLEEGITKVAWKSQAEAEQCLVNSYGSIVDVFYESTVKNK